MLLLFAGMLAAGSVRAAEFTLKVADQPPPEALDASLRKALQPRALQLLAGEGTAYEFWLAAEVPLTAAPASPNKALDAVKTAALLGAVHVSRAQRDYRDDAIAPGVYTLRFALQPQDGNHLGTAEYLYFAVLTPAKLDTKPDGITDYKRLVRTSSQATATDHPVILSLRPVSSDPGETPKLETPAPDHKSIRVKLPGKVAGKTDPVPVAFDLVFEGKSEH